MHQYEYECFVLEKTMVIEVVTLLVFVLLFDREEIGKKHMSRSLTISTTRQWERTWIDL